MIKYTFTKFTKWSVLKKLIFQEIDDLIIGSIGIVAFMSFLIGGVVAIQTALAIENPLLPGTQHQNEQSHTESSSYFS